MVLHLSSWSCSPATAPDQALHQSPLTSTSQSPLHLTTHQAPLPIATGFPRSGFHFLGRDHIQCGRGMFSVGSVLRGTNDRKVLSHVSNSSFPFMRGRPLSLLASFLQRPVGIPGSMVLVFHLIYETFRVSDSFRLASR